MMDEGTIVYLNLSALLSVGLWARLGGSQENPHSTGISAALERNILSIAGDRGSLLAHCFVQIPGKNGPENFGVSGDDPVVIARYGLDVHLSRQA
jgi:hypothetical protein